jgi:SAM-dependent methyltransferase
MAHRQRDRDPLSRLPEGDVPISTGTAAVRRDGPRHVTLMVNGVPSSPLDLTDPTWLEFEYMQQMAVVVDQLPAGPLAAVHLGAGGCALARWLDAVRPGSTQLAVEIDAELARLVRQWFDLPRSPRLRIRVQDARTALEGLPDASADVVVRDVFVDDATPARLCTLEFTRHVARVLRPGGLYLANCADRPPLRVARAEAATVAAAMADVALIAEPGQLKGRRYGNVVIAGVPTAGAAPSLGAPPLARAIRCLPVPAQVLHGPDLAAFFAGAPVLNDA